VRIRTIKPEAFKDEDLWFLEEETGLPIFRAYTGLWCAADREGRFEWRPLRLKSDILPYWEGDFSRVLDALATRGFIVRYACGTREYGWIPKLKAHQCFNNREADSTLPAPPENIIDIHTSTRDGRVVDATTTRGGRVGDAMKTPLEHALVEGNRKGTGREQEECKSACAREEKKNPKPEPSDADSDSDDTPGGDWRTRKWSWYIPVACWVAKSGLTVAALSHKAAAVEIARMCAEIDPSDPRKPLERAVDAWVADDYVKAHKPSLGHLAKQFHKYVSGSVGASGPKTATTLDEWERAKASPNFRDDSAALLRGDIK